MSDNYTAQCAYCGETFTQPPHSGRRRLYCPTHRTNYYHYRVWANKTPLKGYQDIRPGREYKIPKTNGQLYRNVKPGWIGL